MPEKYYIYRIINKINNHDYIGKKKARKTIESLNDKYFGSGTLLHKAIDKYGLENFTKEILEENLSAEEAVLREMYWISHFKNKGLAYYNISPGAEGKKVDSNKANDTFYREKVSESVRKDWENMSEEDRLLRNKHMSEGWNNVDKEAFSRMRSEIQKQVYKNMDKEKLKKINEKRSNTLKNTEPLTYFKIEDPEGNIIEVRSLYMWCKDIFKNYKSAASCLYSHKRYKNYTLIECK